MKSRVDYRLPAALLSLTLLSGSTARGEEPGTGETFVFTACPCDSADAACRLSDRDFDFLDRLHGLVRAAMACEAQPTDLAFNVALPTQCSCGAAITLCGHICDGQRCYETDDAVEGQAVATELAADAKEDLNFRIETCEVAPPMPMLRARQTTAAVAEQAARCELGSPAEAVATAAATSYGPEMLEIVRLRCELEAAQQQLEMQRTHHKQHAELLVELHETKGTAAALASQQEMVSQFVEHTLGLVEEKAELAAKLASAEAGQEASQRLHASELEAVRLEAELAAAKEWISHRLAAEQTMPAPMVAFPYPMPPMFAPPGMIPAPLAVYEPQFVAAEAESTSTARPWQRNPVPVPFAFGTYAPQDPALLCPACPVAASTSVTCGNAACQDAACSNTACGSTVCSDAACGSCSDLACAAPSGKVVSQAAEAVDASAACECKDCDHSECSCANCGCAEQGVCGCEKSCPSSACPAAAAADANFADRGQPSAESR